MRAERSEFQGVAAVSVKTLFIRYVFCALTLSVCGCGATGGEVKEGAGEVVPVVVMARRLGRESLLLAFDVQAGAVDVYAEVHFRDPTTDLDFLLSEHAQIASILVDGRPVAWGLEAAQGAQVDVKRVGLKGVLGPVRILAVQYRLAWPQEGRWQQAAARSKPWMGGEWVYLPAASCWYPSFGGRVAFSVEVVLPEGMEAITEGTRIDLPARSGWASMRYESAYRSEGLTLFAGRWVRREVRMPHRTLRVLLPAEHEGMAETLLAWMEEEVPKLERDVGDYPFESLTVAVHPFQVAVAYPGVAVLGPELLERPGLWQPTLTHEILHQWWGYLVLLGPGGNWMEGLVTYLAEHDWRARQSLGLARRLRRLLMREYQSQVHGMADRPLRELRTHHDRAQELISYAKSALIFHMLRQLTGDRAFFGALRDLTARFRFQEATWDDLVAALETWSGERLAEFSVDWLHRGGAPAIRLISVEDLGPSGSSVSPHSPHRLRVHVEQSRPLFSFSLPVAAALHGGLVYRARVQVPAQEVAALEVVVPAKPFRACLDPDFDLFRTLNGDELEATAGDLVSNPEIRPQIASPPDSALSNSLDLALASALAAQFDRVPPEALNPAIPSLLVLRLSDAVQADALHAGPWLLPWSELVHPDASGQLTLNKQPIPPDASVLLAWPYPSPSPSPNAPLALLLVQADDDILPTLLSLDGLWPWSFAVIHRQQVIARGLWPVSPKSLCQDVSVVPPR